MKTLNLAISGIRPLVTHNSRLADPLDLYVRQIKEISSKGSKKMTDDDLERRDRLEWEGGLYYDSELGPVIPAANIERCLMAGAAKNRRGKDFSAAVFVVEPVVKLDYNGPRDIEKLYASGKYSLRCPVTIQKSKVFRVRPMFPTGWRLAFTIEYDESVVSEQSIRLALINAGALCGLGDYRPRYGRFLVEED